MCIFFVNGKYKNECQFAARTNLSKQDVHGLTSPHNKRVFSSFDLVKKKREIPLGNILLHSELEGNNQFKTLEKTNLKWQANYSSKVLEKNVSGNRDTQRPPICGFY